MPGSEGCFKILHFAGHSRWKSVLVLVLDVLDQHTYMLPYSCSQKGLTACICMQVTLLNGCFPWEIKTLERREGQVPSTWNTMKFGETWGKVRWSFPESNKNKCLESDKGVLQKLYKLRTKNLKNLYMIWKGGIFVWETLDTFLNVWDDVWPVLRWVLGASVQMMSPQEQCIRRPEGSLGVSVAFSLESHRIISEVHGVPPCTLTLPCLSFFLQWPVGSFRV